MRLESFIKFRDLRRAKASVMLRKGELRHHLIIKIAVEKRKDFRGLCVFWSAASHNAYGLGDLLAHHRLDIRIANSVRRNQKRSAKR